MTFNEELKQWAKQVDLALDHYLPSAETYPQVIHEAMRYSVFAGGKRLRPILVMAATRAVGGSTEKVMPVACALELIHTYSLVHDDLPAMDNDEFRRGRLTNHKVYGEAMAILVGDALQTLAFELIARTAENFPAAAVNRVTWEIAKAAGSAGLIGGQVVDLLSEKQAINGAILEYIHRHKTGALFRAAIRAGAILGGATDNQLESLTQYAEQLGLAFQIKDDLLDIEGDEKKIGKPVGSDLKNQKSTYPAIYGLEKTNIMATEAAAEAVNALKIFHQEADFLRDMMNFMITRDY